MSYRIKIFILTLLLASFVAMPSFGEGNIGITVNQIVEDLGGGIIADWEYTQGAATFEIDTQLQAADMYRGSLDTSLTFGVVQIFFKGKSRGYALDGMGGSGTIGAGLTFAVGNLNFDVGIGGANAAPWAKPNALDKLVSEGYDVAVLEGLGLEGINPAPTGLPFKDGSAVQALIATGWEWGSIEVDANGIIELTGTGDKMHQAIFNFSTARELTEAVNLNIGFELGFAAYQELLHYQTATLIAVGYKF